jgi:hypothetical protein
VPVVSIFTMRNGLIQGERILFDLATLCRQAGLPVADALAATSVGAPS